MLPIQISRKMPEFTHHQWKLIFTAVRKYQMNHPQSVPCYKGMYHDLSYILDVLHPYAYSEIYLDETTNT
jgi:hypothetical protein